MFLAKNLLLKSTTPGGGGGGAIAYDSTGAGWYVQPTLSSPGTMTWSHTIVAAGSTVYADFLCDRTTTLSSVTCGGAPMTLVDTVTLTGGQSGNSFCARYKCTGVGSGTQTISCTSSAASVNAVAGSVAFSGGSGTNGTLQSATGTGTSASLSATCTAGQIILCSMLGYTGSTLSTFSVGGGTNRYNQVNYTSGTPYADNTLAMSTATTNTTFTASSNTSNWGGMAHALS